MSGPAKNGTDRRGGQRNNTNALRHGMRAGKLPPGCLYIEHRTNDLRRQIEAAVVAVKGQVTLSDAATIKTIVDWEKHRALAQRWLRLQADKLKPMELLNFSREVAKASTEMDKAIRVLGLDRDKADEMYDLLYGRTPKAITADGQ